MYGHSNCSKETYTEYISMYSPKMILGQLPYLCAWSCVCYLPHVSLIYGYHLLDMVIHVYFMSFYGTNVTLKCQAACTQVKIEITRSLLWLDWVVVSSTRITTCATHDLFGKVFRASQSDTTKRFGLNFSLRETSRIYVIQWPSRFTRKWTTAWEDVHFSPFYPAALCHCRSPHPCDVLPTTSPDLGHGPLCSAVHRSWA
jgi:hypothetical protein